MWRAIRYGLSGGLFDLGALEVRPARAELERMAEWIGPVADELGLQLAIPAANAAERQIARVEEGWTLEEVYAEQVASVSMRDGGLRPTSLPGDQPGEVVRG
jgi:gamma-glutamyl:cysteine ligase YbdK (ATP-grasp superfamily)